MTAFLGVRPMNDLSSKDFPSCIADLDPGKTYNKGQLLNIRIGRNRFLTEALLNDPLAPRFECVVNAKLYSGKDLIDYASGVNRDLSEIDQQVIASINDRVSAAFKKEHAAIQEAWRNLEDERNKWRDEKLQALRLDILSALSADRVRRCAINPLTKQSGVYFLKLKQEIVYVGQSVNMSARVSGHWDKDFDEVTFFFCDPAELNTWEGFFIRLLRPRLNGGVATNKANLSAPSSVLWDRVEEWRNDLGANNQ